MDPLSSYRSDSNDSKIVSGDQRGAQNLFLGLGVRTVALGRVGKEIKDGEGHETIITAEDFQIFWESKRVDYFITILHSLWSLQVICQK